MENLRNVDFDCIMALNNKVLTLDQLNELKENKFIESIECLGYSSYKVGYKWYDVRVWGRHIDIYAK